MQAKKLGVTVLRSEIVGRTATELTARSLRILTYHDVRDPKTFEAQIAWLRSRYVPVTAADVISSIRGERLPPRSVWVTFDDGDPSVVQNGLEILRRHDVPATMFVCPGLIESDEPFWWDRVSAASPASLSERLGMLVTRVDDALEHLKSIPDADRRQIVASLPPPAVEGRRQLGEDEIDRWVESGNDLGNHSWDHPCLDRCDEQTQRRQLVLADEWLSARVPDWAPVFAYPNGNWSPVIEEELTRRRYRIALLHDHRITSSLSDELRVSRLHVDAGDELGRFRSVVAGVQPVIRQSSSRVVEYFRRWR
jgi:peptidoglycan/xylan/chitin deacetylase (PgdA/CDA1 family)